MPPRPTVLFPVSSSMASRGGVRLVPPGVMAGCTMVALPIIRPLVASGRLVVVGIVHAVVKVIVVVSVPRAVVVVAVAVEIVVIAVKLRWRGGKGEWENSSRSAVDDNSIISPRHESSSGPAGHP